MPRAVALKHINRFEGDIGLHRHTQDLVSIDERTEGEQTAHPDRRDRAGETHGDGFAFARIELEVVVARFESKRGEIECETVLKGIRGEGQCNAVVSDLPHFHFRLRLRQRDESGRRKKNCFLRNPLAAISNGR